MHILLIHQAFATLNEPGGTRHHEFARNFARQGHTVTVITGQANYLTGKAGASRQWIERETDEYGVQIVRCRGLASWHDSFPARVVNFISFMIVAFLTGLRIRQVDLVWATTPPMFQAVSSSLIAAIKHKPLLLEVRDLWPYFAIEVGVLKNPVLIRLSRWLEGVLYRRSDVIVVNSPGFIDHVTQRGARQVVLIPNGVDPEMFAVDDDAHPVRTALGLNGAFILLYAGAHGMSNDLGTVLNAAKILRGHEQIHIVLLGDGKEKTALIQRAEELELRNVHFLPPVDKHSIGAWLADADACLAILSPIPAYKTTYPNKVFDYMAAGKPVILAIDGVIRKVIDSSGAGIYVQPGDPLGIADTVLKLVQDTETATNMGRAGRTYVRDHFDRKEQAQAMLALMLDLAGKGGTDA